MTTLPQPNLLVSFIISTHNRRDVLLDTLAHVRMCGLAHDACEVFVVDNASSDGTADAVAQDFPTARLIRLKRNRGACAKNEALRHARGRFIVFLDDDSYPMPGAISQMVRKFEVFPRLGAAVFTVNLPDGSRECSAYPDVFIGAGTGFRRRALTQVGGLPEHFFMQAEEYDLSLRLLQAGWDIRAFDDLQVMHLKTAAARSSKRTTRLDVRNNFLLAHRQLPDPWRRIVLNDWLRRYWLIAKTKGHRFAFLRGLLSGAARSIFDQRTPVDPDVFEQFTRMTQVKMRLARAQSERGLRTVLLVDLGKNVLPYWLAARECGLQVVAIADNRLARSRWRYRGIPIVNDSVARRLDFDAAIIANTSSVNAEARRTHWRQIDHRPVIDLFEPAFARQITAADPAESESRQTAARIA
jgi:GT2 family glycosyltransferase